MSKHTLRKKSLKKQKLLLLDINFDILRYLCRSLNDGSKLRLMITCKKMMDLGLIFEQEYQYVKIIKSSFYDNFSNVNIGEIILCMGISYFHGHILQWPKNLRILKTNDNFNGEIEKVNMPSYITHLTFGYSFYPEKMNDIVPPTVTHLTFGPRIRKLSIQIPSLVTHLTFKSSDIEIAKQCILTSLKYLNINASTHLPDLPPVEFLVCHNRYKLPVGYIPSSVKYLSLQKLSKDIVPKSVTHLRFHDFYSYEDTSIPSWITHLIINHIRYNRLDIRIPSSVTHLRIDEIIYNNPLIIPKSVKHISFGNSVNIYPKEFIPSGVCEIVFGDDYNTTIRGCIPSSVKRITFGKNFNHSLKKSIPSSVTHLTFRNENYKLKHIPSTVKCVIVGQKIIDYSTLSKCQINMLYFNSDEFHQYDHDESYDASEEAMYEEHYRERFL